MTGGRTSVKVDVSGQRDQRIATVWLGGAKYSALVKTDPIVLLEAIGGEGFVDYLQFEKGGEKVRIMLMVRGRPEDNLISFSISGTVNGPKGMYGSCYLNGSEGLQ